MDDHMILRRLEIQDADRGFMTLLGQLTSAPDVSRGEFEEQYNAREQQACHTLVIEDTKSGQIVGTASLLIERKFIRGCSKAGHIEDVVVDASYRGQQLGRRLIEALVAMARTIGCYKVILDCAKDNADFYTKCSFEEKGVEMAQYLTKSEPWWIASSATGKH
ncbi:hypothetical protein WJX84_008139 [Apatococcus fuscideae]|uniref:Glucosamine 6-phosphate N-acetyltransferase n=1 Tax=Apatococcus fuscideae TaxID=2026836 RepID=A0AAW1TFH1_9CHLO